MKHAFTSLALAGTLVSTLALSAAAQEVVTVNFATFLPDTVLQRQNITDFLEQVKQDSNGTLDYRVFFGGTLGRNPAEQLTLVQNGVADMSIVLTSYTPGAYDDYGVAELALADNALEASVGIWNAFEQGLLPTPAGTHIIAVYANGQNVPHLAEPFATLEDLAGRRVRAAGNGFAALAERLGMIPVSIPASSIAESINSGVIGGAVMDWGAVQAFRVSEVTTHHLDYAFGSLPSLIVINEGTWNRLSDDARAAFERHGGRAYAEYAGANGDAYAQEIRASVLAGDGQVNIVPEGEMRATLDSMAQEVAANWVAAGENRQAVVDAFTAGVASVAGHNQ
ncbi:MAG: TRAP transporter substrate-binding protein DctP [Rhodobacter sp.]|nr:TRAP transporter substrate-binding protein DctP [Paracoccaceae bacterium]MCC0077100.1 TRAP transporter substrate-binding protein DctP [Rhodobacter sp.]